MATEVLDAESDSCVQPLSVLLPWTARGASLALAALRGEDRGSRAGWFRREERSGTAVRYLATVPDALRFAFAGLHWWWLSAGGKTTAGLPPLRGPIDVLVWAEQPLVDWPIDLADCKFDLGESIVDSHAVQLTEFGEELARASYRRLDAQLVDEAVFDLLLATAAENPETPAYQEFRRFLIQHPVLLEEEFRAFRRELPGRLVDAAGTLLGLAYRSWPVAGEGNITVCGRCRNTLERHGVRARCSTPWCDAVDGGLPTVVHAKSGAYWYEQRRGVKLYFTFPGLAELELARQLEAVRGVSIEMWPGPPGRPDAYDLAVRFAAGDVWAVDVKDHRHPFRLGDAAIPTVSGEETRRILAVPSWRMARPDYRNRATAIVRGSPVELVDTDELVQQAKRHARGQTRTRAR